VVVSDRAIVKQAGSGARFVYLVEDGIVSFKQVVLGRRLDAEYELVSGVKNGDEIVISGQSKLSDGMAVEVIQ